MKPAWQVALSAALILGGLALLDHQLSQGRTLGWERNSVRNSQARWAKKPAATVAIFGSSTSKDWLPEPWLAKLLKVPAAQILDAHINGCHQGCTWAEIRRMRAEGRRFKTVFFGTNLFQLCEFPHTKRILQQQLMVPLADVPALIGRHLHGQTPLQSLGRLLGVSLSGAYADTAALRAKAERWLYGDADPRAAATRRHQSWRWARRQPLRDASPPLSCPYTPADIALKRAFSEGLLDDLSALADEVYLILLPDRTRSLDDPEHQARWARHLALHQALAAARPKVTLIDLVTDGVRDAAHFRDGFHLNAEGMQRQRALFQARLAAARAPAAPPAPGRP